MNRHAVCAALASVLGTLALVHCPFPDDNALLAWVRLERPVIFAGLQAGYWAMLFTTPYLALSVLSSLAYIFLKTADPTDVVSILPPYPSPTGREEPSLVIGEVHRARRPEPVEHPRWLTIPSRGLYTGIAIFGAIGSGKTSGCMYPFAEQLFAYRAADPERKIGGLVLEVKGDFCHKVRGILERHGRAGDYREVSLDSSVRYNPLQNDLDAYTLAYGIASLLNNLFGKGKDPFWQQAYTNLVKFIILLHKVLDDYVTLFDVYQGAIDPDRLDQRIREGEQRAHARAVSISIADFMAVRELEAFPFERDATRNRLTAALSDEIIAALELHGVAFDVVTVGVNAAMTSPWSDDKHQQFEAVKRWFYQDWLRMDARLRTSIVEGISVFLSLFDDNPTVKRVFCPPKAAYDPVLNHDGRYGRPLPPFEQLIEQGAVCALNFPTSANPGLARTIGTLMKQDFQRAVLNRIPRMEREPDRHWREAVFLCDEYHAFATVGESDPSGDDKFFALSRQAKCVPIVATQSVSSLRSTLPGESWRTLLQTFRTKIFLALSDDFSARTASELCGKDEQLKPQYTLSETGQDAGVSVLSGRAAAHRATIGASKSYSVQRDFVFEPKTFAELKNDQAIVLAYDGVNPWPPTYCYLKPYFLDPNTSYFTHLAKGAI